MLTDHRVQRPEWTVSCLSQVGIIVASHVMSDGPVHLLVMGWSWGGGGEK